MKILITDFLFPYVHKYLNVNVIRAVAKFAEVEVVSLNGYYDDLKESFDNEHIILIPINVERKSGHINTRKYSLSLIKATSQILKVNSYDAVICLTFETVSFGIGINYFQYKKTPLIVFQHNNIDELTSSIKKTIFNSYKNKIYHAVFEECFASKLITDMGISEKRVFIIPHIAKEVNKFTKAKKYDCVGLSRSNDENFIDEALKKESIFKLNNLHIILRSKTINKQDGNVVVINGFMDKDKYDELLDSSTMIFVPLPKTYKYRLSGSIYDAFSRRKVVLTTSEFHVKEYQKYYPGICFFVSSIDDLINVLKKKYKVDEEVKSFNKFLEDHSLENTSKLLEAMLRKIKQSHC